MLAAACLEFQKLIIEFLKMSTFLSPHPRPFAGEHLARNLRLLGLTSTSNLWKSQPSSLFAYPDPILFQEVSCVTKIV